MRNLIFLSDEIIIQINFSTSEIIPYNLAPKSISIEFDNKILTRKQFLSRPGSVDWVKNVKYLKFSVRLKVNDRIKKVMFKKKTFHCVRILTVGVVLWLDFTHPKLEESQMIRRNPHCHLILISNITICIWKAMWRPYVDDSCYNITHMVT